MSIAEIRSELDRLSPEERRHLTAYLIVRDRMLDPEFRAEITRKLGDKNPENWVSLEDLEKQLSS